MVSSQVGFLKKVLILLGFSVTFVTRLVTAKRLKDFSKDISVNVSLKFAKNKGMSKQFDIPCFLLRLFGKGKLGFVYPTVGAIHESPAVFAPSDGQQM